MTGKNKKVVLELALLLAMLLFITWYFFDRYNILGSNSIPAAPKTNQVVAVCSSYAVDACPGSCVVCPPCPECSSVSCQSEEFCAGVGIDRSWYKKIRATLKGKTICERENCHGLDIKCGSNPPEVCTAMYALGDRCLNYAVCELVGDKCQVKANEQFTKCKTCVDSCAKDYSSDVVKMFECEGKCN